MAEPASIEPGTTPASDAIDVIAYTPGGTPPSKPRRVTPLRVALFVLFLVAALALYFVFTARAVWVQISPVPDVTTLSGNWPRIRYQDHYLMPRGKLAINARKDGYYPLDVDIEIGREASQRYTFELEKLPGYLTVNLPQGVDAADIVFGRDAPRALPSEPIELRPGEYAFTVRAPRYLDYSGEITIEGLGTSQSIDVALRPNWADVAITSTPVGAQVLIGDTVLGETPGVFEILAGEHPLTVQARGYKSWFKTLNVTAGEAIELPPVVLAKADGTIIVSTTPAAAITVDGRYRGMSPQTFKLPPGKTYTVAASKVGYAKASRRITSKSDEDIQINWTLEQLLGDIVVVGSPPSVEIWQDDRRLGKSGEVLTLPVRDQQLTVRAPGYAPATLDVLPSPQESQTLTVKLLTVDQAREAELARKRTIVTSDGQTMLLQRPRPFQMGASRRVRGRRANETLRDVSLTRLYYVGVHEVTNARFKAFDTTHTSGTAFKVSLDADDAPVVNVTWDAATRYCNWLSEQEGLPLAYRDVGGTMQPVVPATTGYRLLSEAEWAWAARFAGGRKPSLLPWGDALPPPPASGNFAGRSAIGLVNKVIDDFDDGHAASAPVGSFAADDAGLYDMAGNVSEWTNDAYQVGDQATGDAHVVRGSSWQHSKIGELRFTYRDSSTQGRDDIGFRIARYLE
ncbi:MAG: SUMF1/EgtB/PvdO family nonheme iron enzyme [Pseudomonadota bacterium]